MNGDAAGQKLREENDRLRRELAEARAELSRMPTAGRTEPVPIDQSGVLDQLAEGVILADAAGRIVFVNEAAARMHGVAQLGIAPDGYSAAYQLLTEAGEPYPYEKLPLARAVLHGESVEEARWRIRRPDGTELLAAGSARPLRDRDGAQTGAVLTLRDETARDAAERALRASEARFRAVFDQQFQFMAVLSPEGVTLEINELPLRAAGFRREEVIGRPFWDTPFWSGRPDLREAWPHRLQIAARSAGPVLSEDLYQTAGGEMRNADAAITAVRGPGGEVSLFVIQATDTTDRRRAEAALRESAAEFRAIFETAAAGVTEVDPRTRRYLRVNRRFCEIVGRAEAELLAGLGPDDISHPEDVTVNAAARAAMEESGRFEAEKRYLKPDGEVVWVRVSAAVAARDAGGEVVRTVSVVQDITAAKRAERRQALLVAELNHRAKNALATVQSLAAQTLRGVDNLERFAGSFTARLRALARAHDLMTEHSWEAARLGAVVTAALAPWLPERGQAARVLLRTPPDLEREAVLPRQAQALVMALHELGSNAVKHGALSRPDGVVTVGGGLSGGAAILEWTERGGPRLDGPPARSGFGRRLLEAAIARDLGPGGAVTLHFEPDGLRATLRVPLDGKVPGDVPWSPAGESARLAEGRG